MMRTISISRYMSPVGELIIGSYADSLCVCDWTESRRRDTNSRRIRSHLDAAFADDNTEVTDMAISQLDEYFAGKRRDFTIPALYTGTDFQCRVWSELMQIPYGSTVSYGEIACRIGRPGAVRAVAAAIAANPISVIVPCHRVIGADRRLTGYAGGLRAKKYLLNLESGKTNIETICNEHHK